MYNASQKSYETPGNYTLFMREVRVPDDKNEPVAVLDINEINEKIVKQFNLIAQCNKMI